MATSVEKVHELLEQMRTAPELPGIPSFALPLVTMLVPKITAQLPSDPAELDQMLDMAAAFVAGLRSDGPTHVEGSADEISARDTPTTE